MLNFSTERSVPTIFQAEASECGLVCLAIIAGYYGQKRDLATLRRKFDTSLKGMSLKGLIEVADELGFSTRPVRVELDALHKLKLPCIIHWNMNHFVVLERCRGHKLTIVDPTKGRRTLSIDDSSPHFTGVALEISPSAKFQQVKKVEKVRIRDFWRNMIGLKRSLAQIFILAILLQIFSLLTPLYSQIIIDKVIPDFDLGLLVTLTLAFSLFLIVSALTDLARNFVLLYLSTSMSYHMRVNLFSHLISLPMNYFSKRHVGGIVMRFGSLEPIERLLTTTLVSAVLDGLMALTTVIVIFYYSWQLSIVVLLILLLNLAGTIGIYPIARALTEKQIESSGVEQTTFLEIIRALSTIKTFGRESEREAVWKNALAAAINDGVRGSRVGIWMGFGNGLLFGLGSTLILFLGARLIINGEFTIGMLMAFQLYQGQFIGKAQTLIATLFELRMLGLHLERLADIIHAEPEKQASKINSEALKLEGKITLSQIAYRYAATDPYVLRGLDAEIAPGECLIIRGASGSGKSTLLKLMTGLITPTAGDLLFDDQPIASIGLSRLRRQIGVVSQNDTMLTGTLSENISFFDPEPDMDWVRECAASALIDTDIQLMPMRYDSLVGDMGSALSGGQQQRILLARALYNRPRILILDEATAHIDPETTDQILINLGEKKITRIVVSHDDLKDMIRDRELWLDNGKLVEKDDRLSFKIDYDEIISN